MNTTTKLLGALALLVIVYLIVTFVGGKSRSKSFREVLVEIDTAKVTKVMIENNGATTLVTKTGSGQWSVDVNGAQKVARESVVKNLMSTLESAKPSRLVARSSDKWKDYAVDSSGTRVKIFEGNDQSLDLIIGRFGVEGQRQFHTYVRLGGEDDVYVAKDFMGISIAKSAADYRNSDFIRLNKDSLNQISFNYPDSSFSLIKESDRWTSSEVEVDSAKVAGYVQELSYVTSKNFGEGEGLVTPTLNVTFSFSNAPEIQLSAYSKEASWILQSTENADEFFEDLELFNKVFKGSDGLK